MLHNSSEAANKKTYIYGITFLSILVLFTYLPGWASYINSDIQPSLITGTAWLDLPKNITGFSNNEEKLASVTGYFGWKKIYWLQGNEHEKYNNVRDDVNDIISKMDIDKINNNLYKVGFFYMILTGISLLLYFFSFCIKSKVGKSIILITSTLLLTGAVLTYILVFYNIVERDLIKKLDETISTYATDESGTIVRHVLDWHWRLGAGLICNGIGILILPIANIFLCV